MLERSKMIVSEDKINKFINTHVLIVGVGGVGGACFEALVRMALSLLLL
jgi:tRNA A37 threonylcarbamoyladenosine dehydratase